MTGLISHIQRFSLHDGPGIRTTLFLKGCPLRCPWCHNPETINARPDVLYYPDRCIGCGTCVTICPDHFSIDETGHHYRRSDCSLCLKAAERCPSGALQVSGRTVEAHTLVEELLRDRPFFEESGGGITVSGGEPLAQPGFVLRVLELVRNEHVHTCLDTAAFGDGSGVPRLSRLVDLFLVDCKETDGPRHEALVGVPMAPVHRNLHRISEAGGTIHLRCPIVPGVTDRPDHFRGIGRLADSIGGIAEVHVLPFHRIGAAKWAALGRDYRFADLSAPSEEQTADWVAAIRSFTSKPVRRL